MVFSISARPGPSPVMGASKKISQKKNIFRAKSGTPPRRGPARCHTPHTPKVKKKEEIKKEQKVLFYFRIEKRGLNLMRSMQQGISTHYNTRFGI